MCKILDTRRICIYIYAFCTPCPAFPRHLCRIASRIADRNSAALSGILLADACSLHLWVCCPPGEQILLPAEESAGSPSRSESVDRLRTADRKRVSAAVPPGRRKTRRMVLNTANCRPGPGAPLPLSIQLIFSSKCSLWRTNHNSCSTYPPFSSQLHAGDHSAEFDIF